MEANTPAGTAPGSGAEPDLDDNSREGSFDFSLEVEGQVGTPSVGLAVNGDGVFKEDQANTVSLNAAAGDATDQLTSLEVSGLDWGVPQSETVGLNLNEMMKAMGDGRMGVMNIGNSPNLILWCSPRHRKRGFLTTTKARFGMIRTA